jgi:hypothetical protein
MSREYSDAGTMKKIDVSQITEGMTRADIRKLFGEPPSVGSTSRKYWNAMIWKYGDIEIHFCDRNKEENRLQEGAVALVGYDDANGDWHTLLKF